MRTASPRSHAVGLAAYAQHPLLRLVGIDRGYYQPLPRSDFVRYASQVPTGFRFLVKAPALVADAFMRGERGAPAEPNPYFLDVGAAIEQFVVPAIEGLAAHAGPLLFQLSPLPREMTIGDGGHSTIEQARRVPRCTAPSRRRDCTAVRRRAAQCRAADTALHPHAARDGSRD